MFLKFIKTNWLYIALFLLLQTYFLFKEINTKNPTPYLNVVIYFLSFLLIKDTLPKTILNRQVVNAFFYLFGYLSLVLSAVIILRYYEIHIVYILQDTILKIIILMISLYLIFYSIKSLKISDKHKLVIAFILASMIMFISHLKYYTVKFTIENVSLWSEWMQINYIIMVFVIVLLLIFWYRYYWKLCILSDHLNVIIFLFTVTNIVEPLHYIALQWNVDNWIKGQQINFILNLLMVFAWYSRLKYVNSDISIENERYLINFQYLNGIVSKPRKSRLKEFSRKLSIITLSAIFMGSALFFSLLFIMKKITLFLLINTMFILVIIALALFFSISSIKQDWQNQLDTIIKSRK